MQNFRKICLFRLQNFAFWMQNLRFVFAKNRGDRSVWIVHPYQCKILCLLKQKQCFNFSKSFKISNVGTVEPIFTSSSNSDNCGYNDIILIARLICPAPARQSGWIGAVIKVMIICPAETIDLHLTSTTGYEKRQQWEKRQDIERYPPFTRTIIIVFFIP